MLQINDSDDVQVQQFSSQSQVHVHMALHQVKSKSTLLKTDQLKSSPSPLPKWSQVQVRHILEYSIQVHLQ